MRWLALFGEPKSSRLRHLWSNTDEYVWYAYCGLIKPSYEVLAKSRAEPKCPECERLLLKEKAEKAK